LYGGTGGGHNRCGRDSAANAKPDQKAVTFRHLAT
jgi:hypothetical protein